MRGLFKFDVFRSVLLLTDLFIMLLSMWGAYLLVFDGRVPYAFQAQWPYLAGMGASAALALFAASGVYSRRLPSLGEREVRWLLGAASLASVLCFALQSLVEAGLWGYLIVFWVLVFVSRSLLGVYASYRTALLPAWILYGLPLLLGLAGTALWRVQGPALPGPPVQLPVSRTIHVLYLFFTCTGLLGVRWLLQRLFLYYKQPQGERRRALLVGDGLELLYFTRLNELAHGYQVVGVLDNDPLKWGMRVQDVRVLGALSQLPAVARQCRAETVLMLKDSLEAVERLQVENLCRSQSLKLVRLGSLQESLLRSDSLSTADLLEREEYRFLPGSEENYMRGKRVLVTGAGGSIGSELVRQILRCEPCQVVLLGRGENSIFELERELQGMGLLSSTLSVIANIADREALAEAFRRTAPQVVFHAAAHKHVPLMEANAREAVRNNVLGTWNVMDLAGLHGVERVVMISTDKAVAPKSIMGATKRKAEQVVAACAQTYTQTRYTVVRFGNVLGSRGSVVRLFQDQIRAGGPVTVTDPRMTRYFMTIPEAVSLVLASANLGGCFGIYVLEMGKPYRIVDLAEKMIRLCGLVPGKDIQIVFSGIRPGEKLDEVLADAGEELVPTANSQVRRLNGHMDGEVVEHIQQWLARPEAELRAWLLG